MQKKNVKKIKNNILPPGVQVWSWVKVLGLFSQEPSRFQDQEVEPYSEPSPDHCNHQLQDLQLKNIKSVSISYPRYH